MDFDKLLTGKILKIEETLDNTSELFLISMVKKVEYKNPSLVAYEVFGVRLDTQESNGILCSFQENEIETLIKNKKLSKKVAFRNEKYSFID